MRIPPPHRDSLLGGLRSPVYLRWQAGRFSNYLYVRSVRRDAELRLSSGIAFEAELPGQLELPGQTEATLCLVLREAVTNIHRHSRATEARVVITRNGQAFSMRITDNGCGGLAAHGNGVSGMRERVRQIGGRLAIDSPTRHGTTLDIEVSTQADRLERIA